MLSTVHICNNTDQVIDFDDVHPLLKMQAEIFSLKAEEFSIIYYDAEGVW